MSGDPERAPRTYVVWSAVTTVVCFLPLGIVALLYAVAAQQALSRGDRDLAFRRGRVARRWLVATIAVGLALDLVLLGALVVLGAFSR